MVKPCEVCQKKFEAKVKTRRFCSRLCFFKHQSELFKGKRFSPKTQFDGGHKTWNKGLKGYNAGAKNPKWKGGQIEKTCLICSKAFKVDPYRADAKNCSIECNKLYRKTEEFRSHLSEVQRSNISPELRKLTGIVSRFKNLLRRCSRYNIWRERIMNRDDFTCQGCGRRGGKLCVDHIEPFITIIARNGVTSYEEAVRCKELWETDNGRTLCLPCHYKTPTFGSKVLTLLTN